MSGGTNQLSNLPGIQLPSCLSIPGCVGFWNPDVQVPASGGFLGTRRSVPSMWWLWLKKASGPPSVTMASFCVA